MATDVIIIPAHNRRDTTLRLLDWLAEDGVPQWATLLVVDDGSTDGTAEAIRSRHPSVEILPGTGQWWWAGAIRRGMERALAAGAERVYWLNDDCRPGPGALAALRTFVTHRRQVAWIDARTPSGWSYGAHRKTAWSVRRCTPAEESHGRIDAFSGNCVGIPRAWITRIGLPDDAAFPHGLADLDYGLRLTRAGAKPTALPGHVASADEPGTAARERWTASSRTMLAVWRDFHSPRSFLYFPAWRRFALRHWGPVWGWVVFAAPYVRWAIIACVRPLLRRLGREDSGGRP